MYMASLNTDNFIHSFRHNSEIRSFQEEQLNQTSIGTWMFQHSTVVKTCEIAGMVLGAAAIVSLPVTLPVIGTIGCVLLAVAGGLLATISLIAYNVLDIAAPHPHDMRTHVFKPASFEAGRLYYQGDVPVLELECDDAYKAGKSHGYLMGEQLNTMLNRLNFVRWTSGMLPNVSDVPEVIKEIKQTFSEEELQELQGITDGFNVWAAKHKWVKGADITVDDLILFHLMPDSLHFKPKEQESRLRPSSAENTRIPSSRMPGLNPSVACTVVIDSDKKEGMTFGRNMDWPSFGIFGTYSLVINRKFKNKNKLSSVEIGFPGFAGALTGMNEKGVCVAMNVCSGNTTTIKGVPAVFYNRRCLENCGSVEEVAEYTSKKQPLGCYHMSVAGPGTSAADSSAAARSFHFYQGVNHSHVVRQWKNEGPLFVTNSTYKSESESDIVGILEHSPQRNWILKKFFKEAKEKISSNLFEMSKLVTESLTLPFVDNFITTQKVVMKPETRKIQVAFNNAYAGSDQLHEIDTGSLFG